MYLEIFLAEFAVFRVFWGISRDFAEMPEFRGSATARNIRSPVYLPITTTNFSKMASYLYPQVDSLQISHDNALLRPVFQGLKL